MQWHKSLLSIALLDYSTKPVSGMVCEGLLIHKAKQWYRISHVESGCHIDHCTFSTYREARAMADKLHSLEGFWLKSLEEISDAVAQEGSHRTKLQAILSLDKEPRELGTYAKQLIYERSKV